MGKWGTYGYGPGSGNDPENVRARLEESRLFRESLPVILANADRILATPRYFFCQLDSAYMSSLWWFRGGGPIPLGVLLLLWRKGKMIFECPDCRGLLHAVGISGSMLSGCGSAWGPCLDCGEEKFARGQMGDTMLAVGPMLSEYRNEPVVQRGKRPSFDWKDGLVGEYTPDRVIVPAIEAAPLHVLVSELTGSSLASGATSPAASRPVESRRQGVTPLNLIKMRKS